jgi:hypothetical protein
MKISSKTLGYILCLALVGFILVGDFLPALNKVSG